MVNPGKTENTMQYGVSNTIQLEVKDTTKGEFVLPAVSY